MYRTGWLNPHCGVGNMLYRHGYQEATSTKYPRLLSVSYLRHTLELYKLVLVDIYFSCGPWLRVSWEFYILPLFDRGPLISLLQSLHCHSPFTVPSQCIFCVCLTRSYLGSFSILGIVFPAASSFINGLYPRVIEENGFLIKTCKDETNR